MKAIVISLLLVCLAVSVVSGAQDPASVLKEKVTLSATDKPASEALTQIAEKIGIPILVDEAIQDKINANLEDIPLSKVLDTLCNSLKWAWRVAYLPSGVGASRVGAALSTMGDMKASNLIVQDPQNDKMTVVLTDASAAKAKLSEIADALGLNPAIVIYKPRTAAAATTADVKPTGDPNRVESRFGPPKPGAGPVAPGGNQNVSGMAQQMLGSFRNLSPEQQMQLMSEIRRQWFENLTPQQREEMMRSFRDRGGRDRMRGNDNGNDSENYRRHGDH